MTKGFSAGFCARWSEVVGGLARPLSLGIASLLLAAPLLGGCGSGPGVGSGNSLAPAITTQPASQIVPINRAATFTVSATGTQPLSYQWSRNGKAIPGATGSSYTTPLVALTDSGSTFQVAVGNAVGSVTSNAATLTAGARAPAIGDVRYLLWQQVTVPWPPSDGGDGNDLGANEYSYAHALGTPLTMGSGLCDWPFSILWLPPTMNGFAMYYQEDFYSESGTPYASWLQSVSTPNVVVTSIDLDEGLCKDMGASWVATPPPGQFDFRLEEVAPDQVQATVAADGAQSRIVTAATFDDAAGQVVLISYGWQGDTTTVYEAQTVVATPQNVVNQAFNLANAGYFISAFGGNHADGYLLIGMRVQGDTLPRPITNDFQTFGIAPRDTANGTVVAWFGDSDLHIGATINEQ